MTELKRGTVYTGTEGEALLKFNSTPPKHIIDAVLADKIRELSYTLEVTKNKQSKKLTVMQSFRAALAIWAAEMHDLSQLFKDVEPKTLAPKHRMLVTLFPKWLLRIEVMRAELAEIEAETSVEAVAAAQEVTSLLQVFHYVLDENTKLRHKQEMVQTYEHLWNRENAAA